MNRQCTLNVNNCVSFLNKYKIFVFIITGRHGNGVGEGEFYLLRSYTFTLKYLHVTLHISNKDEKSNFIFVPNGFEYLCPILAVDNFFNKKSIFQSWAQYCSALSKKEMIVVDGYGDGEERDRRCEMWKEKRENLEK